ncbi:MAG: hypothetical protein ACI3YK_07560 [Eubacteriales bacterium]
MRSELNMEEARRQALESVRKQLLPDESLLWIGKPGKRSLREVLNFNSLFLVVFSAVWIGGVLIGSVSTAVETITEVMSGESGPAELLILLFFIPFYLGACLLILTVVHTLSGWGTNMVYALTDRRVLILDVRKKKVKCTAYNLSVLSGIRLETLENGDGTIFFPKNENPSSFKWNNAEEADCFYKIPDAKRVYQMILDGVPK